MQRHRARLAQEEGFTLIELVVALSLSAFAFAALAAALAGGMTALAASKSRAEANEIGTQGIEDLQHYTYDALGFCSAATDAPSGLTSTVVLSGAGCSGSTSLSEGVEPCENTSTGVAVPRGVYSCTRNGIAYTVRRYIAWGDAGQTVKRLAVYVDWDDRVGKHQVSQQSSVRSPGVASLIGLPPPSLSSASVSPSLVVLSDTDPQTRSAVISLSVAATGLSNSDKVYASFRTLDPSGGAVTSSVDLKPVGGNPSSWSGEIKAADPFKFPAGSQFFGFSAIRKNDGKGGSAISPSATKFCPMNDPNCDALAATLPSFVGTPTVTPTPAQTTPSGALKQDLTLTAVSTNLAASDSVIATFQTIGGLVSTSLAPSDGCAPESCTWTGVISTGAGYGFTGGSQKFLFTGIQVASGSTTAAASSAVTFQ